MVAVLVLARAPDGSATEPKILAAGHVETLIGHVRTESNQVAVSSSAVAWTRLPSHKLLRLHNNCLQAKWLSVCRKDCQKQKRIGQSRAKSLIRDCDGFPTPEASGIEDRGGDKSSDIREDDRCLGE